MLISSGCSPQVRSRQYGFNLIELMVGLVVGIVVLGAALTAFLLILTTQKENNQIVRLNQDMRAIADLMVRDIRRAGYVSDNPVSDAAYLLENPFFEDSGASTADLSVINTAAGTLTVVDGSGDCITYAYNRDNSNPSTVSADERFGFKRSGTDIMIRVSGPHNLNCSDGVWYAMNNPVVEFTDLTFSVSSAIYNVTSASSTASSSCPVGDSCLIVRTVGIDMTAQVQDVPTITQNIVETVRLRNDKFVASVAAGSEYATP